ncbi:MAG TPA: hypothetical protein VMC08_07725 [Bacteroidales bacterium]|nr:hypothetical protein [Bacteroidales bacterium]
MSLLILLFLFPVYFPLMDLRLLGRNGLNAGHRHEKGREQETDEKPSMHTPDE